MVSQPEHLHLHGDSAEPIDLGWDPLPRWLRYTGLPQILKPTEMDCCELLLLQTLNQRTRDRPPALPDGQLLPPGAVSFTYKRLARPLGCSEKTVERAIPVLVSHNLLEVLRTGYRLRSGDAEPSWGYVNLQLLERIYRLSCSEIPRESGGLSHQGRSDEGVAVRLFQGEPPIRVRRCLGGPYEVIDEPPVPLVKALCLAPSKYEQILDAKLRTLELQRLCVEAQGAIARGERVDPRRLQERLRGLVWAPERLVEAVENIVESVGKSGGN